MKNQNNPNTRRKFMKNAALLAAGITTSSITTTNAMTNTPTNSKGIYMIGPQEGYTPQVGTLLSTMTMMRHWVVQQVRNLSIKELDWQLDDKSNSIGAMLWHLAATEKYYQLNTFDEMDWGTWSSDIKKEWDLPMNLGAEGREKIKGHSIDFYLEKLESVRKVTEAGFAKRDDEWLQKSEPFFGNQPTNNYCKWFHVCEHESNHNGQIKLILKRI